MKPDKFNTDFKDWLNSVEPADEEAVWESISDELDFSDTWRSIETELDKVQPVARTVPVIRMLRWAAAAAAVILLLAFPWKSLFDTPETVRPGMTKPVVSDELSVPDTAATPGEAPLLTEKGQATSATGRSPLRRVQTTGTDEQIRDRSVGIAPRITRIGESAPPRLTSLERAEISMAPTGEMLAIAGSREPVPVAAPQPEVQEPEPEPAGSFSVHIAEAGLLYGLKNTWLLNNETFTGLDPQKLGSTLPTFHQDFGLSSVLVFNGKHRVGVDFLWKSETGQNYMQYIDASYVEKDVLLTYSKLQLYYMIDNLKIPGTLLLGTYVGKLNLAEEIYANNRVNIMPNYSNIDYGLTGGYQIAVPITGPLYLNTGMKVNYNLLNIFNGSETVPGSFNKTRNLSLGVGLSLSYRLQK